MGLDYAAKRSPVSGMTPTYGSQDSSSALTSREIAHLWELGGNAPSSLGDLLSIVLTPNRLPGNVAVVAVDLSRPATSLAAAAKWLSLLRARAIECADKLPPTAASPAAGGAGAPAGPAAGAASREAAYAASVARMRVGWAQRTGGSAVATLEAADGESGASGGGGWSSQALAAGLAACSPATCAKVLAALPAHPDALGADGKGGAPAKGALLVGPAPAGTLPPLQILLVGTKADLVRDEQPLQRRAVLTALRFLAHTHGAWLITTSSRDRPSLQAYRAALGSCLFGTDHGRRAPFLDAARMAALFPPGSDCMEAILEEERAVAASTTAAGLKSPASSGGAPLLGGCPPGYEAKWEALLGPVVAMYAPTLPAPLVAALGSGEGWRALVDADDEGRGGSSGGDGLGGGGAAKDEAATAAPEEILDSLRLERGEEIASYAREVERKLKAEARGGR